MKMKNVIVLLMSLTLSLVINASPVENDIGATRGSPVILSSFENVDFTGVAIVEIVPGQTLIRTSEVVTYVEDNCLTNRPTQITIESKCRDVDLCSSDEKIISKKVAEINRSHSPLHIDPGLIKIPV